MEENDSPVSTGLLHAYGPAWPALSVVTVSFRDLAGLQATRASVLALDYPGRVQHVIVDGGSGPEVEQWLAEQTGDIVWVSEPDGGIYPAMNKGIAMADGDVLWFMNSADTFHAVDSATIALADLPNPRRAWGFGRSEWHRPGTGEVDSVHGPRRFVRALHALGRQVVPHQAAFFGAELLARVGGYQPEIRIAADQVLMMRCAVAVRPRVLPDVLCNFDMSGVSTGQTRAQHYTGMRQGRRLGGITVTGSQRLDDLASHGVEVVERLRDRGRRDPHQTHATPAPEPAVATTTTTTRTVSVVIPTHDRDAVLGRAIDSALRQNPAPQEILVVDDLGRASTRDLVAAAAATRQDVTVRLLDFSDSPTKGPSASRNHGASQATGDTLAFLDDDDVWLPGYLSRALAELDAAPNRCCVVTWSRRIRAGQYFPGAHLDPDKDLAGQERFWSFGVTGSNLVVDTATFHSVGGYDERLWSREDYEIFVRLVDDGRGYAVVAEELVEQDANGEGHLAGKSLRAAAGVPVYLATYGERMTRAQRRSARRHFHAMSSGRDNTPVRRLYHRVLQVLHSDARDWRMMTVGRLTGNRPAPLR